MPFAISPSTGSRWQRQVTSWRFISLFVKFNTNLIKITITITLYFQIGITITIRLPIKKEIDKVIEKRIVAINFI